MVDMFEQMITRVLKSEGGYSNDPKDPGGETKFGISKRAYPNLNIKDLTYEGAKGIYRRDFWERVHADEMPDGVAFQALDFAVNSGIETAVRKLQAALNVADDGHWGPVTKAAAEKMSESDIIMRFTAQRLRFWTRLKNWPDAGKGWVNRAADNLEYGAIDS